MSTELLPLELREQQARCGNILAEKEKTATSKVRGEQQQPTLAQV